MPFFNHSYEPQYYIDPNKYAPIGVVVNFATDGKMLPVYIRYIHPDESEETIKIDGVKATKDIPGGLQYFCIITVGKYKREIALSYYVKSHMWYIMK